MSIVVCPACGAKNRVDDHPVGRRPVCGKCGTRLPVPGQAAPNKPIAVTDESFAREVLEAGSVPVLLDCWAEWCGPCRMIAPAIEQLAAESDGQYRIAKLNVDENPGIAPVPHRFDPHHAAVQTRATDRADRRPPAQSRPGGEAETVCLSFHLWSNRSQAAGCTST